MFKFGDFDATQVDGLAAVLAVWPGMPDTTTQSVAAPGVDGVFYADSTLGAGRFVFDLYINGIDPDDVLSIAETVSGGLAPHAGLRDLTVDIANGWVWRVNTDSPVEWKRGRWRPGSECYLSARVEFTSTDPYGYALLGDTWEWTTKGVRNVTRAHGNVPSFPTIEVKGVLSGSQKLTVKVGDETVVIDGPLTASQTLKLDYQTMDFGIWTGNTKTSSVVNRMNNFTRLVAPVGSFPVSVQTPGTVSAIRVDANSRRL